MTPTKQVKRVVRDIIPPLPGWTVYDDVATGKSPPWVVVRVSETGRESAEDLHTTASMGMLDIRIVARTSEAIDIIADRLKPALDGAAPSDRRVGRLVPDVDSGVYAAELTDPDTSRPWLMRVLTWRFGWSA